MQAGQKTGKTERERRIRAGVRTVLSPGVWLAVGLQAVIVSLLVHKVMPMSMPDVEAGSPAPMMDCAFAVADRLRICNERRIVRICTGERHCICT